MSARIGASIAGQWTGAPVARATGATAPMWSKWVCVRRIASRLDAGVRDRLEQAVGLLAGIDQDGAVVAVEAHEVGVLGQRPDGERADLHVSRRGRARRRAASSAGAGGRA